MRVDYIDVIVLTQSCDLVPGQKGSISSIVVCPYLTWNKIKLIESHPLASKPALQSAIKGQRPAYHVLERCELDGLEVDSHIVAFFGDIFTLPLSALSEHVKILGKRARLDHHIGNGCPKHLPHFLPV